LSGTLPAAERPGLLECLRAVRDGEAEGIIMRDLDRIARELTTQEGILAQLWKFGGHCYITTQAEEIPQDDPDDPMRTAMRQIMGVFAQLERPMAIKRMKNGRATKAEQGGFAYGSPAYGQSARGRRDWAARCDGCWPAAYGPGNGRGLGAFWRRSSSQAAGSSMGRTIANTIRTNSRFGIRKGSP
jgi:DNA invertase Pin-like site-specific DNA recombinase